MTRAETKSGAVDEADGIWTEVEDDGVRFGNIETIAAAGVAEVRTAYLLCRIEG